MNNEIKRRLPLQCPACDAPLKVGRMFCGQCDTEVCGTFELPVLAKLTDKEQQFVIDFIKSSGKPEGYGEEYGSQLPYCPECIRRSD